MYNSWLQCYGQELFHTTVMVLGVVLDITLELGYWMVKHLGYGVGAAVKYMLSSEPEQLAIESASTDTQGVAFSLDAAAQLRRDGILDDETWEDIVRATVNRMPKEKPINQVRPEPPILLQVGSPAPTAPPPYAFDKPT